MGVTAAGVINSRSCGFHCIHGYGDELDGKLEHDGISGSPQERSPVFASQRHKAARFPEHSLNFRLTVSHSLKYGPHLVNVSGGNPINQREKSGFRRNAPVFSVSA